MRGLLGNRTRGLEELAAEAEATPPIVLNAEAELFRIRTGLALGAAGLILVWLVGQLPVPWLVIALAGIALAAYRPPGRRGRWIRLVLDRWESGRVDQALYRQGFSPDPRIRAAQRMARRIMEELSADGLERRAVQELLDQLHMAVEDLHTARLAGSASAGNPGLSQAEETCAARIDRLLGALGELYAGAVDTAGGRAESSLREIESLVRRKRAVDELDEILDGHRPPGS